MYKSSQTNGYGLIRYSEYVYTKCNTPTKTG